MGNLTIDYAGRRAVLASRPVHLTPTEYRVLAELSANAGRVLTYERLLGRVWGEKSDGDVRPCNIPYAETRAEAERLRRVFTRWCGDHSYEAAREAIERDWERMVTFYDYPREHWRHLRTTNPVESPFAALRLRTDAARRYKRVDRAIAVIWKMLMVAEKRFRRLQAPELMADVYLGAQYVDGIAVEATAEKVAA